MYTEFGVFQYEIQVKMVSTQSDSKFPLPLHFIYQTFYGIYSYEWTTSTVLFKDYLKTVYFKWWHLPLFPWDDQEILDCALDVRFMSKSQ